jgi:rubrerythrin
MDSEKEEKHHKTFHSGDHVEPGSYICIACGHRVSLDSAGMLPPCPFCNGQKYKR